MKKIILIIIFCTFNYLYSYSVAEEEFLSYISTGNVKEVLNYINNKKVDINAQDKRGLTFLMISILQKQNEISKILIDNNANIDTKITIRTGYIDVKNVTILMIAKNVEIAKS